MASLHRGIGTKVIHFYLAVTFLWFPAHPQGSNSAICKLPKFILTLLWWLMVCKCEIILHLFFLKLAPRVTSRVTDIVGAKLTSPWNFLTKFKCQYHVTDCPIKFIQSFCSIHIRDLPFKKKSVEAPFLKIRPFSQRVSMEEVITIFYIYWYLETFKTGSSEGLRKIVII